VEYSPAKEQVEIVTTAPEGSIVADPNEEAKVHWLWAVYLVSNSNDRTKKYIFFINTVWLNK
jgi:hypothetical protein